MNFGRREVLALPLLLAIAPAASAQSGGSPTTYGRYLGVYRHAVARIYGVAESSVVVEPFAAEPPETGPEAALRVGDYHAVTAIFALNGHQVDIRGFVGPDGAAFVRQTDGLGRATGLQLIMRALAVLDAKRSAPVEQIVSRILWSWRGDGDPAEHPDHPWTIERHADGARLRFLLRQSGGTGSIVMSQVEVTLATDYATQIVQTVLPIVDMLPEPLQLQPQAL